MVEYKLTVIGTGDGQYLVNYYHKIPDEKFENISNVIDFIFGLELKVLEAEPSYISLNERDREVIESVRQGIIRRDDIVADKILDGLHEAVHMPPVRKYNVEIEVTNIRRAKSIFK